MKLTIYLYNLMRSTRISIDKRIYSFSPVDNGGQSRRKLLFFAIFFDFRINYLHNKIVKLGYLY